MKIAILNDTHSGIRNSSEVFLDNAETFYSNIFFPECEKRNIEIVETIIKNVGGGEIEYVEDRKGHDWRYAMNTEKIEFTLDWEPKISFKNGIKELLNHDLTGLKEIK